jgi:hypothetical protein
LAGFVSGFGIGAVAVHLLLSLVIGSLGPDGWGAAPAWLLFCFVGAIAGAVVGVLFTNSLLKSEAATEVEWLDILIIVIVSGSVAMLLFALLTRYEPPLRLVPISAVAPPTGLLVRWCVRRFVLPTNVDSDLEN